MIEPSLEHCMTVHHLHHDSGDGGGAALVCFPRGGEGGKPWCAPPRTWNTHEEGNKVQEVGGHVTVGEMEFSLVSFLHVHTEYRFNF